MNLEDLRQFQTRAARELADKVEAYGTDKFPQRYDSDSGEALPFVCRLRAITGAGKTPVLAVTAAHLSPAIILWTTPRGAVISQTFDNLRPGGKYANLLPSDSEVYMLGEMSKSDWTSVMRARRGLTILLATVASFNQDGDELRIHRKGPDNGLSRWEMLGSADEQDGRKRNLYVFYDEGHGATNEQFDRLTKLSPAAFVLASASRFPDDLWYLLPGRSSDEKIDALKARTVTIETRFVAEAGLLKTRLFFTECRVAQRSALKEALIQYQTLCKKFRLKRIVPIACFIVNSTPRAIDVWEDLVALGVPKKVIAVHVNGARDVISDRHGSSVGLVDTYTGKNPKDRSPEALRRGGYTHLIWNLTLREGWDEPLAYVAYLDSRGKSDIDIHQKIGRFLRQPDATPFDDPDLNAAYFYFNVPDEQFREALERTQEELRLEGHEVVRLTQDQEVPKSRIVQPRRRAQLPKITLQRGDPIDNDRIVLDAIPNFARSETMAPGRIVRHVVNVAKGREDKSLRRVEKRLDAESISVWEFVSRQLRLIDTRIIDSQGSIFTPDLQKQEVMLQQIQYGSRAMSILMDRSKQIRAGLEQNLSLASVGELLTHTVGAFRLVNPDMQGVGEVVNQRYKVRKYRNSIHSEYNGLNSFEAEVADALDRTRRPWCRNPSSGDGYWIPVPTYGADSTRFYPDFLLWTKSGVWAIDPKGKHLLDTAVSTKLYDLSGAGVQVALLVEGKYTPSGATWVKAPKNGTSAYTLIKRTGHVVREKTAGSIDALLRALDTEPPVVPSAKRRRRVG